MAWFSPGALSGAAATAVGGTGRGTAGAGLGALADGGGDRFCVGVVEGGACVPAWQPRLPARAEAAQTRKAFFIDVFEETICPKAQLRKEEGAEKE
jgi:hypothetical protein